MKLISGDIPHTNHSLNMHLFDCKIGFGSGISIWSVKQNFGIVSTELHSMFTRPNMLGVPNTVFGVIGSGFFSSIGLFRTLSHSQKSAVLMWANALGLAELLERPFLNLSQGQQRLALIGRALVKQPRISIADELLLGLDPLNRKKILSILNDLATNSESIQNIIYISHAAEDDEFKPEFITDQLDLGRLKQQEEF